MDYRNFQTDSYYENIPFQKNDIQENFKISFTKNLAKIHIFHYSFNKRTYPKQKL